MRKCFDYEKKEANIFKNFAGFEKIIPRFSKIQPKRPLGVVVI